MISYFFPPIFAIGSLRALGFAKHLPEFNWQPYVLSIKNPDLSFTLSDTFKPPEYVKTFYTPSLINLKSISSKFDNLLKKFLNIFFNLKTRRSTVQDLFFIPDVFVGWVIPSLIKGLTLIRKHNIDIIYISCRPFSSALTGVFLKKLTKRPLIIDYRDPISFPMYFFDTRISRNFTLPIINIIEKFVLRNADKFLLTSEETKQLYLSKYPFLKYKTHLIYNGFFTSPPQNPHTKKSDIFTIVYSGNFYYDYPIPSEPFFQALQKVIFQNMVPKNKIRFLYIGKLRKHNSWLDQLTKKFSIQDNVVKVGHVSQEKALEIITESSLFLLRIVPTMIAAKLFDGLSVGIPILATTKKGEAEELIKKYSSTFYIVDPLDVDGIVHSITKSYHLWIKGELKTKKNSVYLKHFNKKAITSQFVNILEKIYTS